MLKRIIDSIAVKIAQFGGSALFVFMTVAIPITWFIIGLQEHDLMNAAYNFLLNQPYTIFSLTLTAATLYMADKISKQQTALADREMKRDAADRDRERRMEQQNLEILRWLKEISKQLDRRRIK